MAMSSSKFIIDQMLPKYAQFQPFLSSQLTSQITNHHQSNNNSSSSVSATPNSEGSPLTGSESSANSPPTSKMYPFVSTQHPTTHSTYSSVPGFSGLDDKSCR